VYAELTKLGCCYPSRTESREIKRVSKYTVVAVAVSEIDNMRKRAMINSFAGPIAAKETKSRKGEASEMALLINGCFVVLPWKKMPRCNATLFAKISGSKSVPPAIFDSPGRIKGASPRELEESLISLDRHVSFLPVTWQTAWITRKHNACALPTRVLLQRTRTSSLRNEGK